MTVWWKLDRPSGQMSGMQHDAKLYIGDANLLEERTLVEFEKMYEFEVLPATRERLRDCNKMLHAILDLPALTSENVDIVLQHVLFKPRPEFAEVAMRLLNYDALERYHFEIARGIIVAEKNDAEAIASMVKYLCGPNPRAIQPVFSELLHRLPKETVLTQQNILKLESSPSLWPRVMIDVLSPKECSPGWHRELMQKLTQMKQPIPVEQLKADLNDLDHDRYTVRYKAKANLINKGEMAIPALRELLLGKARSPEAENQIQSIIAAIENGPTDPLDKQMLSYLAGWCLSSTYKDKFNRDDANHLQQVREALDALSQNPADACITKEAKRILAELKMKNR